MEELTTMWEGVDKKATKSKKMEVRKAQSSGRTHIASGNTHRLGGVAHQGVSRIGSNVMPYVMSCHSPTPAVTTATTDGNRWSTC